MTDVIKKFVGVDIDPLAHAARIKVNDGEISSTVEAGEQCLIDMDENGKVLYIELLGPSAEFQGAEFPDIAIDLQDRISSFSKASSAFAQQNGKPITNIEIVGS